MYTLGDEDDLLSDIKEGVEIAMHREGYSADAVDPIKFNKLAYLAIQDLEVPITYGWYKYGPAPVNVRRQDAQPMPKPAEDCRASSQARIPTPDDRFRSPIEYSYYFTEDLPEFGQILQTPTKEFLIGFYDEYAPEAYIEVYIASARLQQVIDEISENRNWHNEAEVYQQEIDDRLNEIKREILKEPTLSEAVDPFFEYTRLLKNVISGAAALDHIDASQQRFISNLIDYFYGGSWNYVALVMSKNTVDRSLGDNKRQLRNSIDSDLRELRDGFETEILRLQERSDQYDLLPNSYKQNIDSSQADPDLSQQNLEYIEAWSKISDEVIIDDLS